MGKYLVAIGIALTAVAGAMVYLICRGGGEGLNKDYEFAPKTPEDNDIDIDVDINPDETGNDSESSGEEEEEEE